jgi:HlyD family secretion protein
MRTLLLVIVTAGIAGAAGYFGPQLVNQSTASPTGTGGPRPPLESDNSDEVSCAGRLEPESEIIGVGGPAGFRIDHFGQTEGRPLREGDSVKKGEVLVYLDSHDEMVAALKHARAMLDEAKKRLAAETIFGDANIKVAKEKIREAEDVAPLGIKAQEAEVRRSDAELEKMLQDEKRSEKMLADKAIPQSMHDSAKLLVKQAREQLSRNKSMLEQMIVDQKVKLAMSEAQLKSAEAGKSRAELMAQVESLEVAVKLADARVKRTEIVAPIGGSILKIHTHEGESIGPQPILKLGNTDQMVAVAEVYETDILKVKDNQKAVITSKAFPKDPEKDQQVTLTGTVERINRLVHKNDVLRIDPTAAADARVFEVRIKLDNSSFAQKLNYLQVDVKIKVGQ